MPFHKHAHDSVRFVTKFVCDRPFKGQNLQKRHGKVKPYVVTVDVVLMCKFNRHNIYSVLALSDHAFPVWSVGCAKSAFENLQYGKIAVGWRQDVP